MVPSLGIVLASSGKETNLPIYLGCHLNRWDKTSWAHHHLLRNKIPTGKFPRLAEED